MASAEFKKYIISDDGKKSFNEGLEPLKKTYNVLVKLNKTDLRKVEYFIINGGREDELKIQVIFTTFFSSDGSHNVRVEYATSDDKMSQYSIAVLEYVSKYLKKLLKNESGVKVSRICSVCDKKSQTCKKCACRSIYYCSTDCQKTDWNRHKTDCKRITSNK